MRHVYVASHGPFARGLINSLSLLIGDEHGVTPVCAYDGDIVTTEQLEQTLENLIAQANGEEVVVFTDLLGGSINNSAAKVLMRHRHVFVVAGVNMTLLLEFLPVKKKAQTRPLPTPPMRRVNPLSLSTR